MMDQGLTLVERVRKSGSRWNALRKVDTKAMFDFGTNIVTLDSMRFPEVAGITLADLSSTHDLDFQVFERHCKALSLAVHEYTHFVDATSTVWGLRHLRLLDKAYNCSMADESEFYVMKQCYNHLKRLKLPDYYTAVPEAHAATRPWRWALSAGVEFKHDGKPGDRPILFSRFSNVDGEFVARSPISVISLLETNAMAEEIEVNAVLNSRLGDQRVVQERIYETGILSHLYNENLTEYSVCAHMVANHFGMKDVRIAFWASSVISRLALNSARTVYQRMGQNLKPFFADMGLRSNDSQVKLIYKSLADYNPGAIFYVICMYMPQGALAYKQSFLIALQQVMRKLGVDEVFFKDEALSEASDYIGMLRKSPNSTMSLIGSAGFENFTRLIGRVGLLPFTNLNLPPVLLIGDDKYQFHDNELNTLKDFDIEVGYLEMVEGQFKMEAFGDACM